MYIYVYVYIYIYTCVCTYVYIHIYVYVYTRIRHSSFIIQHSAFGIQYWSFIIRHSCMRVRMQEHTGVCVSPLHRATIKTALRDLNWIKKITSAFPYNSRFSFNFRSFCDYFGSQIEPGGVLKG